MFLKYNIKIHMQLTFSKHFPARGMWERDLHWEQTDLTFRCYYFRNQPFPIVFSFFKAFICALMNQTNKQTNKHLLRTEMASWTYGEAGTE